MQKIEKKNNFKEICQKTVDKFVTFLKTKWQSNLFIFIILVSVSTLLYALSFATGYAQADAFGPRDPMTGEIIDLITVYAHNFNQTILWISFITVIVLIITMMFGSVNRKKYYWTNYTTIIILAVGLFAFAIYTTVMLPLLHVQFTESFNNPEHMLGIFGSWNTVFTQTGFSEQTIYTTFGIGYLLLIMTYLATAGAVVIFVKQFKNRNVKVTTYSEMMAMIEDGSVVVDDTMAKPQDIDMESVNIDIKKHKEVMDMSVDKMRYQPNKSSYLLALLSVVFILIAGFISITFVEYGTGDYNVALVIPDIWTALDILLIIFVFLITFLCAEKMKSYKLGYAIGMMAIAVLNLARIFYLPLMNHITYLNSVTEWNELGNPPGFVFEGLATGSFWLVIISLVIGIALQAAAGVIAYQKTKKLHKHIRELGER